MGVIVSCKAFVHNRHNKVLLFGHETKIKSNLPVDYIVDVDPPPPPLKSNAPAVLFIYHSNDVEMYLLFYFDLSRSLFFCIMSMCGHISVW